MTGREGGGGMRQLPLYPGLCDEKEWVEGNLDMTVQRLAEEFRELDKFPPNMTNKEFNDPKNKGKKRFQDITLLDQTRVILRDQPKDDFIHASHVNIGEHRVICSQGPTSATAEAFWRMVWQEASPVILMLCQTKEDQIEKCFQYWPPNQNSTWKFGQFQVTSTLSWNQILVKHRPEKVELTKITLQKNKTERKLLHAQFKCWPDKRIPEQTKTIPCLINTLDKVTRELKERTPQDWGPKIVHCSAGIGRTGTFVVIESVLKIWNEKSQLPHIPSLIKFIRKQRAHSVQTETQFFFIYNVILDHLIEKKSREDTITSSFKKLKEEIRPRMSPSPPVQK